ncbi:hypothetical protein [Chitinimonas koreensis]|uniref:hypothetical protein n=1 Tax=Chitinimonas koreensis TaxID=356302 RepID=UPI0003F7C883|nr:hypothetical protein [Chitinimonas koreensis]QNM97057.1 hypothetical protein H9L41_01595 [Chitinimonas koreensis]
MKAEHILPDDLDTVRRGDVVVRKGSVGAFLANAAVLADPAAPAAEREAAQADLIELLPALEALGLFEVFAVRDPALAGLVGRELGRRS